MTPGEQSKYPVSLIDCRSTNPQYVFKRYDMNDLVQSNPSESTMTDRRAKANAKRPIMLSEIARLLNVTLRQPTMAQRRLPVFPSNEPKGLRHVAIL